MEEINTIATPKKYCLIMVGPSGSGKSTLAFKLEEKYPTLFQNMVSLTTRSKRENEKEGKDYYFINKEEFFRLREMGKLVEFVEFSNNYYALSNTELLKAVESNKNPIIVAEPNGVLQIINWLENNPALNIEPVIIYFDINEQVRYHNMLQRDKNIEIVQNRIKTDKIEVQVKEFKLLDLVSKKIIFTELDKYLDFHILDYLFKPFFAVYYYGSEDLELSANIKISNILKNKEKYVFIIYEKNKDTHIEADLYSNECGIILSDEQYKFTLCKLYGELRKTYE
jgi:guanylate kinase